MMMMIMAWKEGRGSRIILRGLKTLFFLMAMLLSLLLCTPVLLLLIADAILPSALLSASISISSNLDYSTHFSTTYDFRYSLIDVPIISLIRSAIILCVYSICDGPSLSRGPYLGITMGCSVSSLLFVSFKASFIFSQQKKIIMNTGFGRKEDQARVMEVAMFICSFIFAVAHMAVAYRTSCTETRKLQLLLYNIDIEATTLFPPPPPQNTLKCRLKLQPILKSNCT